MTPGLKSAPAAVDGGHAAGACANLHGQPTPSPGLTSRLRAIDTFVLLRYPRLWQTRAHVLLPLAALVYAALTLLTHALLRPALTPTPEDFISGVQTHRGAWDAGLAPQFQTSLVFTLARNHTGNDIAITVLALCGAAFAMGVLCLVIWLRSLARQMPPPTGHPGALAAWAEWLVCALCAAALLGAPLWIFALLSPTAAQRAAINAVHGASRDALLARAASNGVDPGVYLFQSNNNQPLSRIYDAGDRLVGMAFFDLGQDLVVPRRLRFQTRVETQPLSDKAWRISWRLNPDLGQDERAYLAQLADATYARALLAPGPAHRVIRMIYADLLFWWLTGTTALWIFTTRRAPHRHVAATAFAALVLGVTGAFAPITIGVAIAALLAIACAIACIGALRSGVFRPAWLTGVLCLPLLLAFCMLLIARAIDARAPLGVFDLLQPYRPWQHTAVPALAFAALAYLPLLPLLDRALTRLHALPKA